MQELQEGVNIMGTFLQHGKCNSEDEGEEEKVDGLGFSVHHLLLRRRQ
jgi:hypothetical protein